MMKIIITIKNQYGFDTYHPACPDSILFARIAGTKTLTLATMECIKKLGYQIVLKQYVDPVVDLVI
ncbi:hypothetical protein UFOVP1025_23 [uncultured Caudovirales phage]|uniref:Uncharacterized protein n=1 Tax=uncultured Caudovirales phage TaxID=2100421 RepID=A0A6J5P253_9CAUD|nr:hypothetical protein UFOVP852_11 [uncultured Caudovirales phage]CAB4173183.1 hypothetical protein UFOVP948_34 [uncultured Caudovirales phage]CAB4179002.1 hypothetical protein UFOVP1025_23 [uncultured Caudovirales phage]CAB4219913.1 hypothetical protein UFOVP1628_26 [uncultured Caudovirales phage]